MLPMHYPMIEEEVESENIVEQHSVTPLSLSAPILDILIGLRRENCQNQFLLNSRKNVIEKSKKNW